MTQDPLTTKEPARPPRRRKWRRRLGWTLAVIVLLCILFRIALTAALPSVLAKVAKGYGLACSYDRMSLSVSGADAELWHLIVAPKEGGEPFVHVEYCRAHISTWNLLFGRLVVWRLETDGLDVLVDRDADGQLAILKCIDSAAGPAKPAEVHPAAPASPPASSEPGPIDLTPPLVVHALRAQHVHARLRDASVSPPVDLLVYVNLRLSNLASPMYPVRFELEVDAGGILDLLAVDGQGRSAGKELELDLSARLRGVHLKPLAGYLEPLGIRPAAESISGSFAMNVRTFRAPVYRDALRCSIQLRDAALAADGEESLALDRLTVDTRALGSGFVFADTVTVEGGRVRATRLSSGAVRVAGIEVGHPVPRRPPAPKAEPPAAPPASPAPKPPSRLQLGLTELRLKGLRASFRDEAVEPIADLAVELSDASITNVVDDDLRPDEAVQIAATVLVPGVMKSIRVEGSAKPFAASRTLDLSLAAEEIRPDALLPYLRAAGIESMLESGRASAELHAAVSRGDDGHVRAEVRISRARFEDKAELIALDEARVEGIDLDPAALRVKIAAIEVVGPRLAARREASGALDLLGLRIGSQKARPGTAASRGDLAPLTAKEDAAVLVQAAAREEPPARYPAISIARFAWKGIQARFDDEAVAPPAALVLADMGIEVGAIEADFDPASQAPPPSPVKITAALPGLVESATVTGTVVTKPSAPSVKLEVAANGITAKALASHLKPLGLEPELKDGALSMRLGAEVSLGAPGVAASTSVEGVSFADAGAELLGLDAMRVKSAKVSPLGIEIEAIEVEKPRLSASRDASGAFHAAGLKTVALPPPQEAAAEAAAAAPAPEASRKPAEGPPPAPASVTPVSLAALRVSGARVTWSDAAVQPAVETALGAEATLEGVVIGKDAPQAKLSAALKVDGVLESLRATGKVTTSPSEMGAALEVAAEGLRAGPLAAYLPEGKSLSLKDGRIRVGLDAALGAGAAGGKKARLIVSGFDYRDGPAGEPLASFSAFRVLASRIDPAGKVIAIDEVALEGLTARAEATAEGGVQALGLTIVPRKTVSEASRPAPVVAPPPPPVRPAVPAAGAAAPAVTAPAAAASPRKAPSPPPLITLDKLHLELASFAFRDLAGGGEPVVLSALLENKAKMQLLGDEPEGLPPVDLLATGRVAPIIGSWSIATRVAPFAAEPSLQVDVAAQGIHGEGITRALPALKEKLGGEGLKDGRFAAHVETLLKVFRRSPLDIDLARGLGLDFLLKGVEFKDGEAGPVLAGLDELHVDVTKIDPKSGDVIVKAIEIVKPKGLVARDKDGLHVLGLLIKLPAPEPAAPGAPTPAPVAKPAPAPAPGPAAVAADGGKPPAPGPELRIDKFTVTDIDFTVKDLAAEPPCIVPLVGLDVDVRGLSTRALVEEKPVRFNMSVKSGKVPLPAALKGGALGGALGDTITLIEGKDTAAAKLEERTVFEELSLAGKLIVFPKPKGWVKLGASALDLAAFRGPAATAGVLLGGGVFDSAVAVRLMEDGALDTSTRLNFTDLELSEPPDGPIFRYLHLPAPLSTVVFVLRDESGALKVPLDVALDPENISLASIGAAASATFLKIVVNAIAASPFRVAGTVVDVATLGQAEKAEKPPEDGVTIEFAAGDAGVSAVEAAKLGALLDRIRDGENLELKLRHDLGGGDISRLAPRANPPAKDVESFIEGMRRRRLMLSAERGVAVARARAAVAARDPVAADAARARLGDVDRELGVLEDVLDRAHDLLRPGAERQAGRRTREACLALARERLGAVRRALIDSGPGGMEARIRLANPRFIEVEGTAGGKVSIEAGVKVEAAAVAEGK